MIIIYLSVCHAAINKLSLIVLAVCQSQIIWNKAK